MEKVIATQCVLHAHPRGFVGTEFNPGTKLMDYLELRQSDRTVRQRQSFASLEIISGDQEVVELKRRFGMRPTNRVPLELIEALTVYAAKKIGTPYFTDWLIAQEQSPYTTANHLDFLDETIGYILGSRRVISFSTYRLMIAAGDKKINGVSYPDRTKDFITENEGKVKNRETIEPSRTEDVLRLWMSRDAGNGIIDLLETMVLMFGPIDK